LISFCIICTILISTDSVNIKISAEATTPIYRQIKEHIRLGVATGEAVVGERLPSIRELAAQLTVNPNTVARAYAELAREGMIEARARRGVFVIPILKIVSREEAGRRLEPIINSLISEATAMNFTAEQLQTLLKKRLGELKRRADTS
jgi:GntR family transcriptional regulator